ncbi:MAG: M56 family metallopeptidase, partial [Chitinophagales bacterium]
MILNTVISDSLMNALGWTLLHSVWQVGVVGLITALLLKSFQHKTAQLRYGIATTALFTLFAWTTYSFIVQYQHHKNQTAIQNSMEFNPTIDSPTALPSIATPIPQNEVLDLFVAQKSNLELLQNNWQSFLLNSTWTQQVEQYLPYLVYLWLLGFVICFARFAGNLGVVYYLKNHGLQAVQPYWTERINRLQQQMAIRKTVTLAHSALVQVPMVLGYFKPVVLLPI